MNNELNGANAKQQDQISYEDNSSVSEAKGDDFSLITDDHWNLEHSEAVNRLAV